MDSATVTLALGERFRADLEEIGLGGGRIGLAVSGGSDSLALLLLAEQAIPGAFEVATVDHGLRAENADEAAMVAGLCAERGISHRVLACAVAARGNLQASARNARYAALAAWADARGLKAIVTGHHLDDQAETLLMRLNRGAGVRGLAGMRRSSAVPGHDSLPLWRPLLGWRRLELAQIVASAGIAPAHDPSNGDSRFERVRARQILANSPWFDPAALAASAAHLADAEDTVTAWADHAWQERVAAMDSELVYRPGLPRAVELRVIERVIAELGHEGAPRGGEIARLHATLAAGSVGTLAGVRAEVGVDPVVWHFAPAPPRRAGLP